MNKPSPTNVKLSVQPATVDGFTFTNEMTPLLRIADGAEFQKGYPTTISKVVDKGDALEVHLVVPMVRLKERPWWAPSPGRAFTLEELTSQVRFTEIWEPSESIERFLKSRQGRNIVTGMIGKKG